MFGATGFGQTAPVFGAAPATGAFGSTFGAFGQQSAQPAFGAQPTSAFGAASTPAFGATPAPAFGATPAAPAFGSTTTPAFGASVPAFGSSAFGAAKPATAFGGFGATSAFGASQPAFGAGLSTAFGAASTPAFGAAAAPSATPAFGAASAPAFGAAPNAFGSTSQAASPFGGASTAFGAQPSAPSAFGSGLFGTAGTPAASPFGGTTTATPATAGGLFGTPANAFGVSAQAGATGTRIAPFQKTVERDGTSATGAATTANYMTITAMQQYQSKSLEELRWEDYQAGVKSSAAGPVPTAPSAFGSPAGSSAFGLGSTLGGAFGTTTPAFGTAASTPAFGTGGLFGTPASQTGAAFGTTAASPFGTTTPAPAFGVGGTPSAFGTTTNAFNTATTPAFGTTTTAARPAGTSLFPFGSASFGQSTTTPAFGTTSPSIFGTTAATPAPTSLFNTSTLGNLGSAAATSPFGNAFSKPATPAFGTSTPAFGTTTTGNAFTGAFGQTGANIYSTSAFPSASTPSIFSNTMSSIFNTASTPSIFGQSAFGTQPPGSSLQLFKPATTNAPPAVAPTVTTAPYGAFPSLPAVPESKVGISSRPAKPATAGVGSRASPLVSLRATASGTPTRIGAITGNTPRPAPVSALGSLGSSAADFQVASATGASTPGILRPRANPHQLFIREPPPSTSAAVGASAFSPARTTAAPAAASDRTPTHNGVNGTAAAVNGSASPYNPFPLASRDAHDVLTTTPTDKSVGPSERGGVLDANASGRAGSDEARGGDWVVVDAQRQQQQEAAVSTAQTAAARPRASRRGEEDNSYLPELGRLAAEGYSYEPSSAQLAAMHEADPKSLTKVSNFTVEREGVGSIRWLRPVDVRGLKLEGIISIQHGEVACYTEGDKPPEGQGLNQEATVTLMEIYKMDKDGVPVRDGPALIKWEKSLRKMCAAMGAKFISYRPAGGVWKFEVEHFSRYGLILDDEDEDDDVPNNNNTTHESELQIVADTVCRDQDMRDGDLVERDDVDIGYVNGPQGPVSQRTGGSKNLLARSATPSAPLQHSLPTHLAVAPSHLLTMQDAFFIDDDIQPAAARSEGRVLPAHPPDNANTSALVGPNPLQQTIRTHTRAPQVWRNTAPAIQSSHTPTANASDTAAEMAAATAIESAQFPDDLHRGLGDSSVTAAHHADAGLSLGLAFRVGWGPGGQLVIPGPPGLRMGSGAQPVLVRRVLVEGEGGGYGAEGGLDDMDRTESTVVPPRLAALRARLRAMLTIHLRHSTPKSKLSVAGAANANATDDAALSEVPQWRLRCGPESLPGLVSELVSAALDPRSPGPGPCGGAVPSVSLEESDALTQLECDEDWQMDVQHEVETWRLLQVLFEAEPPGSAAVEADTVHEDTDDQEGPSGMQVHLQSSLRVALPPLSLALHRQAAFSRWLQRQTLPEAQAALQRTSGGGSAAEAMLHLLSAHHLPGAAAVAVAAGDVRLGTLLSCAGLRAATQTCAREQLDVWKTSGIAVSIQPERWLVYQLLAGQVSEVIQHLQLDWQRALGLYFWYQTNQHVADTGALVPFERDARQDGADAGGAERNQPGALAAAAALYNLHLQQHEPLPWPLPQHCRHLPPSNYVIQDMPIDMQYTLLQLWVAREHAAAAAAAGREAPPATLTVPAQLLAAASHSHNPCSAALPWSLLTVLQALRMVDHVTDRALAEAQPHDGTCDPNSDNYKAEMWEVALSTHMSLIAQVLLVTELSEWAVYVALHLPDQQGRLRQQVVRAVLALTAPQWVDRSDKETFLREVLLVPQVLLSEAAAAWALAQKDNVSAVRQYLAAEMWSAAHDLLTPVVAPQLICQDRFSELRELLTTLQPHADLCAGWQHGGGVYLRYLTLLHSSTYTYDSSSAAAAPLATLSQLQSLAFDLAETRSLVIVAMRASGTSGTAEQGTPVLARLAALELLSKRVQVATMNALATEYATSPKHAAGVFDLPCLVGAFAGQASTRSTALNAATYLLTQQVLAL